MKIRILLYRTPWKLKFKYLVNQFISFWTWSWWSHIEVWKARVDGSFSFPGTKVCSCTQIYHGTCYTSTMRDGAKGTVSRDASKVLKHPENWDYIELEITDKQHEVLIWWLDMKVAANKGYSKRDIMKFLVPIHFDDYQREICSELINDGLVVIQVILGFGIFSPGAVAKKLKEKGLNPQPLVKE